MVGLTNEDAGLLLVGVDAQLAQTCGKAFGALGCKRSIHGVANLHGETDGSGSSLPPGPVPVWLVVGNPEALWMGTMGTSTPKGT